MKTVGIIIERVVIAVMIFVAISTVGMCSDLRWEDVPDGQAKRLKVNNNVFIVGQTCDGCAFRCVPFKARQKGRCVDRWVD